ncbi:MAG TPA: hypothetical protein VFL65_11255 [Jatrophihabitans sp.]|nr:hypothetical protein [Jatrophihabitans sp.]
MIRLLVSWLLRLTTAAALAIDAYVHADLAGVYDGNRFGAAISQGNLFRVDAALAALAALVILLSARRLSWSFAALVAAAGLGAILLYRYVDVGSLGPLPNMYEPIWYPEKTLTAIAEGVAIGTALLGLVFGAAPRRAGPRVITPAVGPVRHRVRALGHRPR